MKRKFKSIIAVLMAVCLSVSIAGCGKEKSIEDLTEKDIEKAISGLDKNNKKTSKDEDGKDNNAEKITYAPTQEILDADFGSGLVQIGNDVFQTGGYITVREFVELYKDDYEETVVGSTDELHDIFSGESELLVKEKPHTFYIMPKKYDTNYKSDNVKIRVRCENKLTVEKGSVYDALIVSVSNAHTNDAPPTWYPKGFNLYEVDNEKGTDNYKEYLFDDFPSYLDSQNVGSYSTTEENAYAVKCTSKKENLNGNILEYTYFFYFSNDTDKYEYTKNNTFYDFSFAYYYPILKQSIIE